MKLSVGCDVDSIVYDSRKACEGSLFVCLRGFRSDGHSYIKSAYDRGCRDFLCEYIPDDAAKLPDIRIYRVRDTREALADLSAEFFGHPANQLKLIGVTGTKGKTSVSVLLFKALNRAGYTCGYIGTTGIDYCGKHLSTLNSTPESYELHKTFAAMYKAGCEYCVMEVTSQAYKTGRVRGIRFDFGVFTNLSPDHIGEGEHDSFEDYRRCKSRLFADSGMSILNADDDAFGYMASSASRFVTYGTNRSTARYYGENIHISSGNIPGVSFTYCGREVFMCTPGRFSVYNALAVLAACDELGCADAAVETLAVDTVPGRFETVYSADGVSYIIDYAHNEMSLRAVLTTLREYKPGRLVCLFGAVGHSPLRRGGLGRAAGELADFCIVTSDNPDRENPESIMRSVEAGILSVENHAEYILICDRAEAIRYAAENALEGDIILLAGKGHEDYQIVNGERVPFCEREILLGILSESK